MNRDMIEKLLKENNGIIKSEDIATLGVDNKVLQRMALKGELERISHGLYLTANYMKDEYMLVQYRCSKCVFSHETALYFHDLSDRTPFQLMMTIPSGFNSRLLKDIEKYKFFYSNKNLHNIGVTSSVTSYGNQIKLYDKERTICDCIKKIDKLDSNIVLTAVKRYMSEPGADYTKLLRYAEIFKVRDTVKQYMDVLT